MRNIKDFFHNAGKDKLFITLIPAFCAVIAANQVFTYSIINGLIIIFAIAILQLAIQLFDDYIDWILGRTHNLKELEQTGIRALYTKGAYFLKDKSKTKYYFYIICLFFTISITLLIILCNIMNDYKLFWIMPILILAALLNYLPKLKKYLKFIGTESIISFLGGPLIIVSTFYACTKCIMPQVLMLSIIFYFLIFNICYVSSELNIKTDILTQKSTFPLILNNEKYEIYFSLFFTISPFILTYFAIATKLLPTYSFAVFILIPQALWQFYLMYKYKLTPQDKIKWHILMGEDKNKTINEQNNVSWYFVRYNFARNIFITYGIILTVSLLDFTGLVTF